MHLRMCILLLLDGMSYKYQLSLSGLMSHLKPVFPYWFSLWMNCPLVKVECESPPLLLCYLWFLFSKVGRCFNSDFKHLNTAQLRNSTSKNLLQENNEMRRNAYIKVFIKTFVLIKIRQKHKCPIIKNWLNTLI